MDVGRPIKYGELAMTVTLRGRVTLKAVIISHLRSIGTQRCELEYNASRILYNFYGEIWLPRIKPSMETLMKITLYLNPHIVYYIPEKLFFLQGI